MVIVFRPNGAIQSSLVVTFTFYTFEVDEGGVQSTHDGHNNNLTRVYIVLLDHHHEELLQMIGSQPRELGEKVGCRYKVSVWLVFFKSLGLSRRSRTSSSIAA